MSNIKVLWRCIVAKSIGVVSHSDGAVTVRNSDGYEREVGVGGQIFDGEVVSVKGDGAGITFNNGCNMSLGKGESALIDETVYKLEFFDDAEVVVDLESAEGISQEVVSAQEELEEETEEVVTEVEPEADGTWLAGLDEDLEDEDSEDDLETAAGDEDSIDDIETAAGEEEGSQVHKVDMDERIDFDSATARSGFQSDNEPELTPQTNEYIGVERAEEAVREQPVEEPTQPPVEEPTEHQDQETTDKQY